MFSRPRYRLAMLCSSTLLAIALVGIAWLSPGPVAGQAAASLVLDGPPSATSPGAAISYTLRLTNTGSVATTYSFEQQGGSWQALLPSELSIEPDADASVRVWLRVPESADDGDIERVGLLAVADGEKVAEIDLLAWLGGRMLLGRQAGCRYDLDLDGAVTLDDVDRVEASVGLAAGDIGFDPNLDFDHSGEVDRGDVERVVDALRPACPALIDSDSLALQEVVTIEAVRTHLERYQVIAEANGGNRAARQPGYLASVDYVAGELSAAGYEVNIQPFDIPTFEVEKPPYLARVAPDPMVFAAEEIATMGSSGKGIVTASLQAVDIVIPPGDQANSSSSACQEADFADFEQGSVALIQRGSCNFSQKVNRAENAGASAVIIFNEGQPDRQGTLRSSVGRMRQIPVLGASFAVGEQLAASLAMTDTDAVTVQVEAYGKLIQVESWNVLADTAGGRDDRVVVLGGHLDSVPAGAGINDNGTGTAAILETAIQVAALGIEPSNRLRFAFWGGEELGLLGSSYYVGALSDDDRADIMANLNFDMIGSPNFFRGVYDGDGSIGGDAPVGPAGSGEIESVLNRFFESRELNYDPTPFSGRSDYGPFIARGIPAGGLFTGAESEKSALMARRYGGTEGQAYDPCYHQGCDGIDNVSWDVLDEMSDAVAHAAWVLAMDRYIPVINGRLGRLGFDGPERAFEGLLLPWLSRP